MSEFLIKYRDGNGDVTDRRISDLRSESAGTYDAFCALRKARRPFRMDRIIHAVSLDTGEILNPYCLLPNADLFSLEALTWRVVPAIKALKFFALSIRRISKREEESNNNKKTTINAYSVALTSGRSYVSTKKYLKKLKDL